MEKRFIVTALLITLLSVVFSMSGDGGNVPVVKNESENVDNQVEDNTNNDKIVPVVNTGTVKDQFGIDTGMTKEELENFKNEYLEFQKNCGIYGKDFLFYHKANLNAISEFANHDMNLNRTVDLCTSNDFVVKSELIVIVSFLDFSIEKNKELTYPITLNVKVHEVLMNNTEYTKIPDTIIVKGTNFPNWHFDEFESGLTKMYKNGDDKYVLFLSRFGFMDFKRAFEEKLAVRIVDDTCFDPFTFAFVGYQRKIEDNEIMFDETKNPPVYINLDQFKKNVKEINRINDIINFYKRSYK